MKQKLLFSLILILLLANGFHLFAQKDSIKSKEKAGLRKIKLANDLLMQKKIVEALPLWLEISKNNPENAGYNFKTGLCYYFSEGEQNKSLLYFKEASTGASQKFDFNELTQNAAPMDVYYFLGNVFLELDLPDSALYYYQLYKKKNKNESLMDVEKKIQNTINIKSNSAKNDSVKSNEKAINTAFSDRNPVLSAKSECLIIGSRRNRANNAANVTDAITGKNNEDIYIFKKNGNEWNVPEYFSFNTDFNETPLFLSADGLHFFFCRYEKLSTNIYYTHFQEKWSEPIVVEIPLKLEYEAIGLSLSADTKTVFISGKKQNGDNTTIYTGDFEFPTKAKNLQAVLKENSEKGSDVSLYYYDDYKTLFFASNRYNDLGFGEKDIFYVQQKADKKWSSPKNVGNQINTSRNDISFWLQPDYKTAWLASMTLGNNYDIFQVKVNEIMKELAVSDSVKATRTAYNAQKTMIEILGASPEDAVKKLQQLEPQQSANLIKDLPIEKAVQIINIWDNKAALPSLQLLSYELLASIVEKTDEKVSVEIMNEIQVKPAGKIMNIITNAKALKLTRRLSSDKIISILNNTDNDKVVAVTQQMEQKNMVQIVEGLKIEKVVDIVEAMPTNNAVNIVSNVNIEKAIDIVEDIEPKTAGKIFEGLNIEKAIDIIDDAKDDKIAGIMNVMDKGKAAGLISKLSIEIATNIMIKMDASQVELLIEYLQNLLGGNIDAQKIKEIIKKYFYKAVMSKPSVIFKTVYFESGKSSLLLLNQNELMILVEFMKEYPISRVEVVGHTDNTGDWDVNLGLSGERAKEVYNFLRKNQIEHSRIIFYGKGNAAPIETNETETGRQHNRRVEVVLLKKSI